MKRVILFLACLMLPFVPGAGGALELASLYPESAAVGTPVSVLGGPFGPEVRVVIGGAVLTPRLREERRLVFTVPPLAAGAYPLQLMEGTRLVPGSLVLRVTLPPPRIIALEPSLVDACAGNEPREVRLSAAHLQPGAQLLLDGRVVPVTVLGETEAEFSVPDLPAGSHAVQMVNPDGNLSLPHTLAISDVPQILQVAIGQEFVNYYQLRITGKNFHQASVLVISEYPAGFSDLPPQQRLVPNQGAGDLRSDNVRLMRGEGVYYQDCTTLLYNRYPFSGQNKRVILRVSNPDGKQSSPFEIEIP